MSEAFAVKTPVFEGPLDLLLDLIERRKLHISDISLAQITDDYIGYLEKTREFPMHTTAHFLLIASTLLLIKARSLLPSLPLTEEEEGSIADLERRLREYKRIKELSRHVEKLFGKNILYFRESSRDIMPIFSPTREISIETMVEGICVIIGNLPRIEAIPQLVIKKIISLEEMIEHLSERMAQSINLSFREFTKSAKDHYQVVVSFLALLELVKRGLLAVRQEKHLEDIHIEKTTESA